MTAADELSVRVLVPAGVLGWGVRADEIAAGLDLKPHAIAVDAGSTDSGPAYLATGRSKYGRQSVKRDLSILMDARRRAGIPLLIGSCGTSGCDMAVDDTLEIANEVACEQGSALRIAVLYSEQSPKDLKVRNANGKVNPLARALQDYDAWITGVRRDETSNRRQAQVVEWDDRREMVKVNPIVSWTQKQVDDYITTNGVLVNPLVYDGYPSIGCATCTLRVEPGANPRSGRWAGTAKTECGIHS